MARLDTHFPIMSSESAAPLSISRRLVVDELARELDLRRKSYSDRVDRNKMTRVEADWQIDVFAAIHADLEADLHFQPSAPPAWVEAREKAELRLGKFHWRDLIAALRREIGRRRHFYPQMVTAGQIAPSIARQQLERMETAHFYYWLQARRWWPEVLDAKRYRGDLLTDEERQIYREGIQRHCDLFEPLEDVPRGEYAPQPDAKIQGWAA